MAAVSQFDLDISPLIRSHLDALLMATQQKLAGKSWLAVHPCEGFGCSVVRAKPQDNALPRADQHGGSIDQFLNHLPHASSRGRTPTRSIIVQLHTRSARAKDVHTLARQLAFQVIGIELAGRQPSQIEVGIELRLELFVRAVVRVRVDDSLRAEPPRRELRHPAFEHVVRYEQNLTFGGDSVIGQTQYAAHGSLQVLYGRALLPRRYALALARRRPQGPVIAGLVLGQCGHVDGVWVPIDQPIDLIQSAGLGIVVSFEFAHDRGRVETQIGRREEGCLRTCRRQALGLTDGSLGAEPRLPSRMLKLAQRMFQAVVTETKVLDRRVVAIDTRIGSTHTFLGPVAVVHHEGIDVDGQPATARHIVVMPLAREERRTRGLQFDPQRRHEKGIDAIVLDHVEVALALDQQSEVGPQDVAVVNTVTNQYHHYKPLEQRRMSYKVVPRQGPIHRT
jgi:hypothetical protein